MVGPTISLNLWRRILDQSSEAVVICSLLLCLMAVGPLQAAWNSLDTTHFTVFYLDDAETARRLGTLGEAFYPEVIRELGAISLTPRIEVWLSESEEHFRKTVNAPIQDWAAACAYPAQRRIIVQRPGILSNMKLNFANIVKHELVHVVLGQRTGDMQHTFPRWYSEGVAMYLSEPWDIAHRWRLMGSRIWGKGIPLSALRRDFPAETVAAHLAYTESFAAVGYLVRQSDPKVLHEIARLMSDGNTFEQALQRVTAYDLDRFEQMFAAEVRRDYHWWPLLTSSSLFWVSVTAIMVLVYRTRKRRQQRTLEAWEDEEKELDPFFQ